MQTRNYAERLLQAELTGKIRRYYYSYSLEDTAADRRYIFDDNDGVTQRLFTNQMSTYLASIDA